MMFQAEIAENQLQFRSAIEGTVLGLLIRALSMIAEIFNFISQFQRLLSKFERMSFSSTGK